jgi:acetyl esterase
MSSNALSPAADDTPLAPRTRRRASSGAQYAAARLLARLPDRVKIALSGEPPVVVNGQALDPMLQLLRAMRRRRGFAGLIHPSIAAGRARFRREASAFRGPLTEVGQVRDFAIAGAGGPLGLRHYAPPGGTNRLLPLMVYFHGGGFVIGDLDTHDEPCRLLCRQAAMHVVSVNYRLAPEHRFPAAIEDAAAALEWAFAYAASLGADPARVCVGGDSAGANLAAVVSLMPRARMPAAQLLIYPPTDRGTPRDSHRLFGEEFLLLLSDRDLFFDHYVEGAGIVPDDPRVSPLRATDLSTAPPALVAIAGFDILRDEGEAYAAALQSASVRVSIERFPSLEHGFIHMTGVAPAARLAVGRIAARWRDFVHEESRDGASDMRHARGDDDDDGA